MSNRIEWIDALKGFAILTVVIGHCADGILSAGMYTQYQTSLRALYDFIYSFHMPLFFIISGFVFWLSASYDKYKTKVFDFVIVYLIWDFLTWLVKFLLASRVNRQVGFDELLGILYHPINPMWYLYVLIAFYLLFSVLGIKKVNLKTVIICGVIAVLDKMLNLNIGILNQILYYAYFFVVGGYIEQTKLYTRIKVIWIGIASVFLMSNMYLYISDFQFNVMTDTVRIFAVANLASLICFYVLPRVRVNNILKLMGENTLQIYVVHCFITAGLRLAFKATGINNLLLYMIAGTFLGVLIPILIARVCSKLYYFNFVFQPTRTIKQIKFTNKRN